MKSNSVESRLYRLKKKMNSGKLTAKHFIATRAKFIKESLKVFKIHKAEANQKLGEFYERVSTHTQDVNKG